MTVPVPLTDNESHTIDVGPVYCPSCKREYGNTEAEALREALRIAVEALHEVAVDHEPMPVNDGRDWCSKCQNYMRGDSGCTAADAAAALAAVRELVDLGGDDG